MDDAAALAHSPLSGDLVPGAIDEALSGGRRCAQWPEELIRARADARYWRAMHQLAVQREAKLKEEVKRLEAKVKQRERELFARRSERRAKNKGEGLASEPDQARRKRGQQPGARGHGRRGHEALPAVVEEWELAPQDTTCPQCRQPFEPLATSEDSQEITIEVRAHRRVIRRRRYQATCRCPGQPGIITAPGPDKLIPKGGYGVSFWVMVLLDKYLFQRPTYRLLEDLRFTLGLSISAGTVVGGLKYLMALFEPLYEGIIAKNISDTRWHADETRWLVFAEEAGKQGHKWYLWVFQSTSSVVYRLDPSRASTVVLEHFGEHASGILNVDRYSAYKVLLEHGLIVLAFCWAHVRRDFLAVAKDHVGNEAWGLSWVEDIARLYRLNDARCALLEQPEHFAQAQRELERGVAEMLERRDRELADPELCTPRRKVLESLQRHWSGLTVFVEHPEVPMDNNAGERRLRNPVVGRKNYYGSGARWSGELAVMLFSLFQTLLLWNINPRTWLTEYLQACRGCQGQAPDNALQFLPWNLEAEQLCALRSPTTTPINDTS